MKVRDNADTHANVYKYRHNASVSDTIMHDEMNTEFVEAKIFVSIRFRTVSNPITLGHVKYNKNNLARVHVYLANGSPFTVDF